MAETIKKQSPGKNQPKKQIVKKSSLPFTAENYYLFFAGLVFILVGYFLLGSGDVNGVVSLTFSPVILTIGYLVIIPLAILYRRKEKEETQPV
jgi:hypothetical protein